MKPLYYVLVDMQIVMVQISHTVHMIFQLLDKSLYNHVRWIRQVEERLEISLHSFMSCHFNDGITRANKNDLPRLKHNEVDVKDFTDVTLVK